MRLKNLHIWHAGLLLVLCWSAVPARASAQPAGEQGLQEIQQAFARGDAGALLAHSADRIEITLLGVSTLYSRSQALYVMRSFFRDHPPARFSFDEPSKTRGDWFVEGHYWHGPANERLRVYVRLRQRGRAWELRSIRIEPHTRR